jgi:hypothetical protein
LLRIFEVSPLSKGNSDEYVAGARLMGVRVYDEAHACLAPAQLMHHSQLTAYMLNGTNMAESIKKDLD